MNIDWAKQWMGKFSAGVDTIMDMYADDVQFEDVIFAHSCNGKAELAKFFAVLETPEAGENAFTVNGYSGDASGGAVEWTWQAKHAGDFLGVSAKGKETTLKGVSVLTFNNGKIAAQRDFWDAAGALKQLGAMS